MLRATSSARETFRPAWPESGVSSASQFQQAPIRDLGVFNAVELVKSREHRLSFAAKGDAAMPMSGMMSFSMRNGLYLSFYSNAIRLGFAAQHQ